MAVLRRSMSPRRARGRLRLHRGRVGAQLGGPADPSRHEGRRPRHVTDDLRAPGAADAGGARRRSPATDALQHPPHAGAAPARPGRDPLDRRRRRDRRRHGAARDPGAGRRRSTVSTSPSTARRSARRSTRRTCSSSTRATLADGPHQLAVNVAFDGGGYAIAVWQITVANAPGSVTTAPTAPVALPIAKSSLPAAPRRTGAAHGPARALPRRLPRRARCR